MVFHIFALPFIKNWMIAPNFDHDNITRMNIAALGRHLSQGAVFTLYKSSWWITPQLESLACIIGVIRNSLWMYQSAGSANEFDVVRKMKNIFQLINNSFVIKLACCVVLSWLQFQFITFWLSWKCLHCEANNMRGKKSFIVCRMIGLLSHRNAAKEQDKIEENMSPVGEKNDQTMDETKKRW